MMWRRTRTRTVLPYGVKVQTAKTIFEDQPTRLHACSITLLIQLHCSLHYTLYCTALHWSLWASAHEFDTFPYKKPSVSCLAPEKSI